MTPQLLGPHDNANRDTIITTSLNGAMAMHVNDVLRPNGDATMLERIAEYTSGGDMSAARSRAEAARVPGVNALHRAHREAWAARWRDADILITGDEVLQRNVRFCCFS